MPESESPAILRNKSLTTTISMPGWMFIKLRDLARTYNKSMSQMMRIALGEFIEKEEEVIKKISR